MAITNAQQARQLYKKGSKKPVVQGGVDNYLGDQPEVQAPRKWLSSPDKPATELAYITEAEKNLILKANIHGGLEDGPNMGPSGIISLDSFGDIGGGGSAGVDTSASGAASGDDRTQFTGATTPGGNVKGTGGGPPDPKLPPGVKDGSSDVKTKEDEKKAKKEAKKFRRETKKKDDARRKAKLKNILEGNFSPVKIGEKFYANPYGLSDTELADLVASGIDKEDLAKNDTDALNSLFEKNDRFSGVNLEAFQNEFNLPKTGLTSLDIALGFAEPFLRKNSKKTKEFFSGTEDGLGNTIFGKPRKSVLEAGRYTIDGMPISPEQFAMLDPALMDDVYKDYMGKRMSGETDAYGNPTNLNTGGGDQEMDPCKGPNPPAYCNVGNDTEEDTTPKRNLGGLAPRFAGSIFDFTGLANGGRAGYMDGGMMEDTPEGGIMDLESGRQMYFLGKLVKKATRAVKKVAKSPFGKMALLGLGAGMAGFGPAKGLFASGKGLGFKDFLTKTLLGPEVSGRGDRSGGLLGFIKNNPYKSIFAGSTLLGLMGDKEDKGFDIDAFYAKYGLGGQEGVNKIRYDNPLSTQMPVASGSIFAAADGGLMRTGYQEGGDAEPVAKKTMPLLDMDGMEKDYREDGGFVPIGRMERADDVPARLSKNEFVFTADAVRNAGEGDIDKGAEVMYNMMKNLESGGEVSEESQGLDGAREMFKTSQRLEEVL